MSYDSRQDTSHHINKVRENLFDIELILHRRGIFHDASKLESPEKELYDKITPLLKTTEYGTDEYRRIIREELNQGLDHHYQNNDHHPEYYEKGITEMSFFSLLEMLADWKAANDRVNGDFSASLRINQTRFKISEELMTFIYKTCEELFWI